jgi:hypothetical protein
VRGRKKPSQSLKTEEKKKKRKFLTLLDGVVKIEKKKAERFKSSR